MTLPTDTETPRTESLRGRVRDGKRTARNALLCFAAVVLVASLVSGAYLFNLVQTFNSGAARFESAFPEESTRPQKVESVGGKAAVNILVMGSDSRGSNDLDPDARAATDERADTLMLVHIPAHHNNVYIVSLMRDLWVQIPGHGESKINAALALGGVPLIVQTVESLFQQRIDHVAMVDFEGFKGLTDALGGVEVEVEIPFAPASGPMKGHYYQSGLNALDGDEALAFVRERKSFIDGDYQRVRNQQSYLKSVIGKATARETLTNPVTITNMISAVSPFVTVDRSLDSAAIGSLAVSLKDIRQKDTVMFTLPTRGIGTSPDGQSIVLPDKVAISEITEAFSQDKMSDYVTTRSLTNGN